MKTRAQKKREKLEPEQEPEPDTGTTPSEVGSNVTKPGEKGSSSGEQPPQLPFVSPFGAGEPIAMPSQQQPLMLLDPAMLQVLMGGGAIPVKSDESGSGGGQSQHRLVYMLVPVMLPMTDGGAFPTQAPLLVAPPQQYQQMAPMVGDGSQVMKPRRPRRPKELPVHAFSMCTNCQTTETSLWRRSPLGEPECNSCNLYWRKNGVPRPVSFAQKAIQRRKRVKPAPPKWEEEDCDGEEWDESTEGSVAEQRSGPTNRNIYKNTRASNDDAGSKFDFEKFVLNS